MPSTAVVREEARTFCVVVANGKAVRKPVTLGLEDGDSCGNPFWARKATKTSSKRMHPRWYRIRRVKIIAAAPSEPKGLRFHRSAKDL